MLDFKNAEKAFDFYYNAIESNGVEFDGTKALFNIGFYINNPADNHITTSYRNYELYKYDSYSTMIRFYSRIYCRSTFMVT